MQKFLVGDGNMVLVKEAGSDENVYNDCASIYKHFFGEFVVGVKYVMSSQLLSFFAIPWQVERVRFMGDSTGRYYYGLRFPTPDEVRLVKDRYTRGLRLSCPNSASVSSLPSFIVSISSLPVDRQFELICQRQASMATSDVLRLYGLESNMVRNDDVSNIISEFANEYHIYNINDCHKFQPEHMFMTDYELKLHFINNWKKLVLASPILDIEAFSDGSVWNDEISYANAITNMSTRIKSTFHRSQPSQTFIIDGKLYANNIIRRETAVKVYVNTMTRRHHNAIFLFDGRFNVIEPEGVIMCPYVNKIVPTALLIYLNAILDALRIAGFNASFNTSKFIPLVFPYPSVFVKERLQYDVLDNLQIPHEYYTIFVLYQNFLATGTVDEFITRTSPHYGSRTATNQDISDQAQLLDTVMKNMNKKVLKSLEPVSVNKYLLFGVSIPDDVSAMFSIVSYDNMTVQTSHITKPHFDPRYTGFIHNPPIFSRMLYLDTELNGNYTYVQPKGRTHHGWMKNANAMINYILIYKIYKQKAPRILYLGGGNGKSLVLVRLLFPMISFTVIDKVQPSSYYNANLYALATKYNIKLSHLTHIEEYMTVPLLKKYANSTYIYSDVYIDSDNNNTTGMSDVQELNRAVLTTTFHSDIMREAIRINDDYRKSDAHANDYLFRAMAVKLTVPYTDGDLTVGKSIYIHGYQKNFCGYEGRWYLDLMAPVSDQMHVVSCTKLANALVVNSRINKRSYFNNIFINEKFDMLSSEYHQFCSCYNCVEWLLNIRAAFAISNISTSMDIFIKDIFQAITFHDDDNKS